MDRRAVRATQRLNGSASLSVRPATAQRNDVIRLAVEFARLPISRHGPGIPPLIARKNHERLSRTWRDVPTIGRGAAARRQPCQGNRGAEDQAQRKRPDNNANSHANLPLKAFQIHSAPLRCYSAAFAFFGLAAALGLAALAAFAGLATPAALRSAARSIPISFRRRRLRRARAAIPPRFAPIVQLPSGLVVYRLLDSRSSRERATAERPILADPRPDETATAAILPGRKFRRRHIVMVSNWPIAPPLLDRATQRSVGRYNARGLEIHV
jgi:hypothetical protein